MSVQIQDGKGRGNVAAVNDDKRLIVAAETNLTPHFVSERDGLAFNTISEDDDAAAGDYIFYFKNTDADRDFFVDIIRVCSENAATFKLWAVTGTGSGTTITPVNLNRKSGVTATATALGNAAVTGLTAGDMLAVTRTAANTCFDIPFDDILILGTNDAIAVEYDTGTTGDAEILMRGYFQKSEAET